MVTSETTPCVELRQTGETWTARTGNLYLRLSGAAEARATGTRSRRGLTLACTVRSGRHRDFVLELSDQPLPATLVEPDAAMGVDRGGVASRRARA